MGAGWGVGRETVGRGASSSSVEATTGSATTGVGATIGAGATMGAGGVGATTGAGGGGVGLGGDAGLRGEQSRQLPSWLLSLLRPCHESKSDTKQNPTYLVT